MRKFWPFMTFFFFFGAFATVAPLVVLYYQELGFSGAQIGLISGFTPLVTTVSAPFWANLADRRQIHTRLFGLLFLAVVVVLAVFPLFRGFLPIFALLILFSFFNSPFASFTDTATMHMLGDEKGRYGSIRLGGTFGFGIAAVLTGLFVERYEISFAFYIAAVLFIFAFLTSRKLEFGKAEASSGRDVQISMLSLIRERPLMLLMAIALASGIGFSAMSTYFYPYMAGLGARESLMGNALFVGTLAEIPILLFSAWIFKRFRPYTLLILATLITGARLVVFGLNEVPNLVLVIQLFNGLTFTLMWMAGVAYADKHAPVNRKATVQGLFGAMTFGIGAAIGGFLGGVLLEEIGGNGLFLVFGAVVIVITLFVAFFGRESAAETVD